MDNTSLQNLLKRLCKVMWEANVTNPITYVTQISYLLFLKMLEEMDTEQADNGNTRRQSIFTEVKIGDAKVDFGKLRWSRAHVRPRQRADARNAPHLAPETRAAPRALARRPRLV